MDREKRPGSYSSPNIIGISNEDEMGIKRSPFRTKYKFIYNFRKKSQSENTTGKT